MNDELRSFVPSMIALGTMALAALFVTLARGGIRGEAGGVRKAAAVAIVAVVLQAGHFVEEATTGLNHRLPGLFGLPPVAMGSFVMVNVVALAVWVLAAWAVGQRSSWALFPLWFLGIASVANAVLHPTLALATGGYFPGLITSPVVGVSGLLLLSNLARITRAVSFTAGRC